MAKELTYRQRYRAANLEKCRKYGRDFMRNSYHANPEAKAKRLAACKKWAENNPEKVRAYQRAKRYMKKYGLTVELYEKILAKQNGSCSLCKRPPTKGKLLVVDHNHKNGNVRGLLCQGCNRALGLIEVRIGSFVELYFYMTRDHHGVVEEKAA